MLYKSNLLAQAAGALAGTVWSHNRGGAYTRNRSIPTDPSTAFQTAVRGGFSAASGAWPSVASSNRAGWETYAGNVPLTNKLGDSRAISGNAMYVRCNSPRITFLGPTNRVDAPPTTMELPLLSPPVVTITTGSNVGLVFTGSDPWLAGTNGRCLVFASRQQSPSVNFFKGPYQFAGSVRGTTGANVTLPFSVTAGNKVFFQFRVTTDDGRLSTAVRGSDTF